MSDAERWEPEATADGSLTVRHPLHGEACHSRAGAWSEARERYAQACRLPERLARGGPALHVLDVGTGLGFNIAAALEAAAQAGGRVTVTTLELDESVLRRALALGAERLSGESGAREWLAVVLDALARALAELRARELASPWVALGAHGELRLVLGDARRTLTVLESPRAFDAIFLDAFSPRVEPELWDPPFLRALAARLAPGGVLSTYSAATRVRAGLAAAGLRVGPGLRFGTKAEGTLASPDLELARFPARAERRLARRAEELRAGAGGEAQVRPTPGIPAGSPDGLD